MPIGQPPLQSTLPVMREMAVWPKPWGNFFTSLWQAIFGWSHTFSGSLTHDFGLIAAQSQSTTTLTITGVAVGDAVIVRPTTAVNGIVLDGTVTAANTVTIRAVNYSAAGIDPASQIYNVIVFQQ